MSAVRVPWGLYFQSRFFAATRKIWKRLGDLESKVVRQEAGQRVVDRPVYIAGLPRSGTTILTEMLEKHPHLRNSLRAVKGMLQVGLGVFSAYLTGGLGPWDLLIGTATERATKAILEKAGGYVH